MLSYFMGLIPTKNDTRRFLFFQEKKTDQTFLGSERVPSPSSKIPEAPASAGRKLSQKVLPSRKIFARRLVEMNADKIQQRGLRLAVLMLDMCIDPWLTHESRQDRDEYYSISSLSSLSSSRDSHLAVESEPPTDFIAVQDNEAYEIASNDQMRISLDEQEGSNVSLRPAVVDETTTLAMLTKRAEAGLATKSELVNQLREEGIVIHPIP